MARIFPLTFPVAILTKMLRSCSSCWFSRQLVHNHAALLAATRRLIRADARYRLFSATCLIINGLPDWTRQTCTDLHSGCWSLPTQKLNLSAAAWPAQLLEPPKGHDLRSIRLKDHKELHSKSWRRSFFLFSIVFLLENNGECCEFFLNHLLLFLKLTKSDILVY